MFEPSSESRLRREPVFKIPPTLNFADPAIVDTLIQKVQGLPSGQVQKALPFAGILHGGHAADVTTKDKAGFVEADGLLSHANLRFRESSQTILPLNLKHSEGHVVLAEPGL